MGQVDAWEAAPYSLSHENLLDGSIVLSEDPLALIIVFLLPDEFPNFPQMSIESETAVEDVLRVSGPIFEDRLFFIKIPQILDLGVPIWLYKSWYLFCSRLYETGVKRISMKWIK